MSAALRTLAQLWAAVGTANDTANFALNDPVTQSQRLVCDVWAANPSALSLNPAGIADSMEAQCSPYYEELGVEPPGPAPPPFSGAQCPGVVYRIRYGTFRNGGSVSELGSSPKNFVGPVEFFDNSDGFSIVQGIRGSQGESASASISRSDEPAGFEVISVERVDGQPDDCGDPPAPFEPTPNYPRPPSFNPDGTVTPHPDTGDTTINIDTRVDIDGDEYFEVTGPGFEYVRSPGFREPRIPEEQPEATDGPPSQPTGDGGEVTDDLTEEQEEQGLETIGYAWSLSNYPSNAGIVQDTNPDVFFTPLGNVQLVYDVNGSDRFSDNLPIRAASGTIIRNDASLKVRAVRFNKRPDVGGITLTPIRRVKADAS